MLVYFYVLFASDANWPKNSCRTTKQHKQQWLKAKTYGKTTVFVYGHCYIDRSIHRLGLKQHFCPKIVLCQIQSRRLIQQCKFMLLLLLILIDELFRSDLSWQFPGER